MVEKRNCTFCGNPIEPGTGKIHIKNDGQSFYFCSNKCKKNLLKLGRKERETKWTQKHAQEKAIKTYKKKDKEVEKKSKKKIIKKKEE